MKKEAASFINEERKAGETTVLVHDIFTNGIGYLNLLFDLKKVPAPLFPYVGVLKAVLMMVNTKNYSYGDLFNEVNIHTGGIRFQVSTYLNANKLDEYRITLEVRSKSLYENRDKALRLMKEIILSSDYEDDKRLHEIIAEARSRMQASMMSAGIRLRPSGRSPIFHPLLPCRDRSAGSRSSGCSRSLMIILRSAGRS